MSTSRAPILGTEDFQAPSAGNAHQQKGQNFEATAREGKV